MLHYKSMNSELAQCRDFTLFFADFPVWLEGRAEIRERESLRLEYDGLFKGTRGDAFIPLWASACRNGVLLDALTLEILQRYRVWGYAPADMDGNPPDFIGQQFRFLAYLYENALKGPEKTAFLWEAESFFSAYLKETAEAVAEGIRRYGKSPVFLKIAEKLAGFSPEKPAGTAPPPPPALPEEPERLVNTGGRNNCGGKCPVRVRTQNGCILGVEAGWGSPEIRPCLRGRYYRETYLNPQRLRYPLQRVGGRGEGRFRRVSWEDAADIAAEQWIRIRDAYGPASRYVQYATGVSAVLRPGMLVRRLLALDGGYLDYYNSYSSACSRFVTPFIYGDHFSGNSIEDILHTNLLILWGHNPQETVFGSERNYYLAKVRDKGIPIAVIDPRESDTVRALKAEWIPIRPGSDAALADAMAYLIWSEGLQDQPFMDAFCLGFSESPEIPPGRSYYAYLFGKQDGLLKSPEWAERITGIPAARIADLARRYAKAKPGCLLPGLGLQRTGGGEQAVRTIAALTCLTGNVGVSGGGAAGYGGVPGPAFQGYPVPPNPYPGKIPSFLWTQAVEDARSMTPELHGLQGVDRLDTDIKLICNFAGNTLINQHSDINRTVQLLKDTKKCEFILCSDVFMTASAGFADILLPAPSFLEDENIAPPWDFGEYLLFNNKVIDPIFGARFEYGFIGDLARRLGLWEAWSCGRGEYADWLSAVYGDCRKTEPELPEYTDFKLNGGYRFKPRGPYIAYADQIASQKPFPTPSGKIEIFSQRLYDLGRCEEVPPVPGYRSFPEGPEDPLKKQYPLQLIGWHTKKRTHSIGSPRLERVDPQRLWVHPADAEARGLRDGDLAEVWNDRGRLRTRVHVTERIIPGAVALAQGAGYAPDSSGVDTAGSINALTSQRPTPLARGNPQHTNLVEVGKVVLS